MISQADFQPLSVAKINIFSSTTRVLQKDISKTRQKQASDKVHAILIEEVPVQRTLRDGTSFCRLSPAGRLASLIGLKYLHQPSNFMLNILTLICYV